jgi:hypothetical protein
VSSLLWVIAPTLKVTFFFYSPTSSLTTACNQAFTLSIICWRNNFLVPINLVLSVLGHQNFMTTHKVLSTSTDIVFCPFPKNGSFQSTLKPLYFHQLKHVKLSAIVLEAKSLAMGFPRPSSHAACPGQPSNTSCQQWCHTDQTSIIGPFCQGDYSLKMMELLWKSVK